MYYKEREEEKRDIRRQCERRKRVRWGEREREIQAKKVRRGREKKVRQGDRVSKLNKK